MSDRDPLNSRHRLARVAPGRLAWPAAVIVALAGATPALAVRTGLPMPGVSAPSTAHSSPGSSSTVSSSSSGTVVAGHTASTAGSAAPAKAAPTPAPAPAPTPGATRQSPSQGVASSSGAQEGRGKGGFTRSPPSYRPHPGASVPATSPLSAAPAPADAPTPSSSAQGNSPRRYAASAGPATDTRSSSSSAPMRAGVSGAAADTASRGTTRPASAEVRPAPLAEIVPTAAEWSDARRQASAARVVPLSQTQTLAGGTRVARTADCVPTTFVPDAKRPGELSIGHSSRDLARSVSTTQDVARVFARTRFDAVDLGVSQSMCLPPDLAGRLVQLPPAVGGAARPGVTMRAGKSRVEPATGTTG